MSTTEDGQRDALRAAFVEERGYWSESLDALLEHDPGYLEQVIRFTGHPSRHGVLEPKVKELILLVVDSAATHRNAAGAREHARLALDLGATPQEVLEVLELTTTIGIHSCSYGVPILLEELAAAGQPVDVKAPLTARQEQIKAECAEKRGYWNEFWDGLPDLDPD